MADIPETPDETRVREQREKRAAAEQEKALGNLPGNLAGALGPAFAAALAPVLSAMGAQPQDLIRCEAGHPNLTSAKFCAECGTPMGSLVPGRVVPDSPQGAVSGPQAPPAAPAAPRAASGSGRLQDKTLAGLQAIAAEKGLDASGTRKALIGRIRAARNAA
jgi:hypothetical protein